MRVNHNYPSFFMWIFVCLILDFEHNNQIILLYNLFLSDHVVFILWE